MNTHRRRIVFGTGMALALLLCLWFFFSEQPSNPVRRLLLEKPPDEAAQPADRGATTAGQGGIAPSAEPRPEGRLASQSELRRRPLESTRPGLIRGRVVAADGQPIAGAQVFGYREDQEEGIDKTATATTTSDGSFALEATSGPVYVIEARAEGYVASNLARLAGQLPVRGAVGRFALVRLTAAARLKGRVLAAGEPVASFDLEMWANAVVAPGAEYPAKREHVESADGRFEVDGLPDTVAAVEVAADAYGRLRMPVKVRPGGVTDLGDIVLQPGTAVSGFVRDRRGRPVGQATVHLRSLRSAAAGQAWMRRSIKGVSGDDGSYRIKNVPVGRYRVSVAHEQYRAEPTVLQVPPQNPMVEFDLEVTEGGVVTGRILDSDGNPRSQASVVVDVRKVATSPEVWVRRTSTDSQGQYRISGLDEGEYSVSVRWTSRGSGVAHRAQIVKVPKEGVTTCDFIEGSGCRLHGVVDGWELAGANGDGLVLRLVAAATNGQTATRVQEDGSYSFDPMPPGPYYIMLPGLKAFAVELPEAAEFRYDFSLPTASISGTVFDADGRPVEGAMVRCLERKTGSGIAASVMATSNRDGQYEFKNLPEGVYELSAQTSDRGDGRAEPVQLRRDAVLKGFDIILGGTGDLVVAVFQPDGQLAPEASVLCQDQGGNVVGQGTAVTNRKGEKALANLPPGVYRVFAGAPGLGTNWVDGVVVGRDPEKRIEITLPDRKGRVEVFVNQQGTGVQGALVVLLDSLGRVVREPISVFGTWGNRTDAGGVWLSGFLPAGPYTVRVFAAADMPRLEMAVTVPGDDSTVRLDVGL